MRFTNACRPRRHAPFARKRWRRLAIPTTNCERGGFKLKMTRKEVARTDDKGVGGRFSEEVLRSRSPCPVVSLIVAKSAIRSHQSSEEVRREVKCNTLLIHYHSAPRQLSFHPPQAKIVCLDTQENLHVTQP